MNAPADRSYQPVRQWCKLAMTALAAVAFSSVVGILPTIRIAGHTGLLALGAAGGVVWVVYAAGAVPVAMTRSGDPRGSLQAVMLATALRFVGTVALACALALGTTLPRGTLLLWIAIDYVVAVGCVTIAEVRLLRTVGPEKK